MAMNEQNRSHEKEEAEEIAAALAFNRWLGGELLRRLDEESPLSVTDQSLLESLKVSEAELTEISQMLITALLVDPSIDGTRLHLSTLGKEVVDRLGVDLLHRIDVPAEPSPTTTAA